MEILREKDRQLVEAEAKVLHNQTEMDQQQVKDRQLVEAKAKVVRSQLMEAKSGCSIDLVEADARVVRRQLVEAETRVLHSWWSLRPGWSAAAGEG